MFQAYFDQSISCTFVYDDVAMFVCESSCAYTSLMFPAKSVNAAIAVILMLLNFFIFFLFLCLESPFFLSL